MSPESILHEQVAAYLRSQYPDVLFHTDFGSGLKMTMGQAVRQKKLQCTRAWPDIFIAEPRRWSKGFMCCGYFLELKAEGTKIYLKDGVTLVASEHIKEQSAVIDMLREKGYRADFIIGFDAAKKAIDNYLR